MEDKNYKELTSFIGEQFNLVHQRIDGVEKKVDSVEKKVDGGFKIVGFRLDNLEKRMDNLEFKFDELRGGFVQLQSAVDAYAQKANTYFMELAALGNKIDRHEKWINQIAEKLGIKLG